MAESVSDDHADGRPAEGSPSSARPTVTGPSEERDLEVTGWSLREKPSHKFVGSEIVILLLMGFMM